MAWRGVHFSVTGSIAAVFTDHFKIISAPENTLGQIYMLLAIAFVPMALLWSTSNVLPNVLRAAGDVNFTSYVSLITMWLIRVGCSYAVSMKLGFGIEGVWICMGVEWLIRSVIFIMRFHSDRWLNQKQLYDQLFF